MNKPNKLLAAALLTALSIGQAQAFDWPSFLGGKTEVSVLPAQSAPAPIVVATNEPSSEKIKKVEAPVDVTAKALTPNESVAYTPEVTTVNPYTGNRVDIERRRAQIERAGLDSDLFEKQYKAKKNAFLLENSDKLFELELKERLNQGQSRASAGNTAYPSANALPAATEGASKPVSKKQRAAEAKRAKEAQAALQAAFAAQRANYVEPLPQLTGVVSVGGVNKAILTSSRGVSTVMDGDRYHGEQISEVTEDSLKLGGKLISLNSSALSNTLTNPDKQVLGHPTTGANTPIGAPVGSNQGPAPTNMAQGFGDSKLMQLANSFPQLMGAMVQGVGEDGTPVE